MDIPAVVDRHRDQMILISTSASAAQIGSREWLEFVLQVEADEARAQPPTPGPQHAEEIDVFFCCLSILQMLTDRGLRMGVDPFEYKLLADLNQLGDALARGEPLPPGHLVGWHDDLPGSDDEFWIDDAVGPYH